MTETRSTFPAAFRLLAMACAALLLALAAPLANADPSQQGVDQAKNSLDQAKANLAAQYAELARIEDRLNQNAALVDQQEGALEQIQVDLAAVRQKILRAQERLARVHQRLNERSAEAFMSGPGSNLGFLLGSASFSDFSDRLEFVDAVTTADAALAQSVANLEYELQQNETRLSDLRVKQVDVVQRAKDLQAQTLADLDRAQQIRAQLASDFSDALSTYKKKKKELRAFRAQQSQGSPHSPVAVPAGFEHVLQVCPVDQPRAFGDGFGAPRYAGGYHLHKGVDILAPYGTAIRAPFDGTAYTSFNSLGGNVVFVVGRYGSAYNAHLQSYSSLSNGPVHAGDVVGYVGDTGDAVGTPHDHFEFHPNVMPSSWPVSAYGYSVVADAVNPYPLLVGACG